MLSKAQIKYIQSLRQKKFRADSGAYIAEGPKIAAEVLEKAPEKIAMVLALPSWIAANELPLQIVPKEQIIPVDDTMLERVSLLATPNEVLLVLRFGEKEDWNLEPEDWCVALDGIQDPGNLGTIIRIADWFGITHILCSEECAEWQNPKVIQASMGSFLRVQLKYTSLKAALKNSGRPIYAATLDGDPITGLQDAPAGIILVGNESKGLSEELRALSARKVTIPRIGEAESLNAAVATGILLSHFIQT